MRKFNVTMATRAQNDLYDITNYLNGFSSATAENYYKLILKRVYSLETFPTGCPFVRNEKLRKKGYRWTSVPSF